jgi:hypothetical protein
MITHIRATAVEAHRESMDEAEVITFILIIVTEWGKCFKLVYKFHTNATYLLF